MLEILETVKEFTYSFIMNYRLYENKQKYILYCSVRKLILYYQNFNSPYDPPWNVKLTINNYF